MSPSQTEIRVSADQIYALMTGGKRTLTAEQRAAVQDASPKTPTLVVAGAGSGKTELMAVRVLWLVANGFAKPEEVLGLTFTRKAASELNRRIFDNLVLLRASELWPQDLTDDLLPPTVSTYNSYANTIFRNNALALGFEPEAPMLSDASAYILAKETILRYGSEIDSDLGEGEFKVDSLVESVQKMAAEMTDHLANAAAVEALITDVIEHNTGLEKVAGKRDFSEYAYMQSKIRAKIVDTPLVAKLAEAYKAEKQKQGFVDYSDQVALAELAARTIPEVAELERAKYKYILLDEYQDTSFLQTRLLTSIFKRKAVYAVGDPNQSIYAWRGASATNLSEFGNDFGTGFEMGDFAARQYTLSTSWRNPRKVLELANHLAQPLAASAGNLNLVTLQSREGAPEGAIEAKFLDTVVLEAKETARWFKAKMLGSENKSTAALLLRSRGQMHVFVEALEEQGLEVEVVGLGGLLEMPEVVDLVCALKVLARPNAGTELIRLLAGPRWRIGVSDIAGLHRYAKQVAKALKYDFTEDFGVDGEASLVDSLDIIVDSPSSAAAGISELGFRRLKDAGRVFRAMRKMMGLSLPDLAKAVAAELWLDIEVMSHPNRKNPMSHLNAFSDVVANYASNSNNPSLNTFLDWLDFAQEREKFEVPTSTPESGVVQVLTVHASKGLEWDHVAICNLVKDSFPSTLAKDGIGWLKSSKLPYPLRGDKASLPQWNYQNPPDQKSAQQAVEDFQADWRKHQEIEETRLVYVAITRPKASLLLTGAAWKPGVVKAVAPSKFLLSIHELVAVSGFETDDNILNTDLAATPWAAWVSQVNPIDQAAQLQQWPLDPLSLKSQMLLTQAAAATRSQIDSVEQSQAQSNESGKSRTLEQPSELLRLINLLIDEREQQLEQSRSVDLPVRVPASRFKDFVLKTGEVAESYRRPVPSQPFEATRTGTLFHSWIEASYANEAIGIPFDELDLADDFDSAIDVDDIGQEGENRDDQAEVLETLKQNFAKSEWAGKEPLAIEIEIQITHGINTFICKLDAVYETETGVEIVDWKTGKAPKDEAELAERSMQLALYKLAYSKYAETAPETKSVKPGDISVAFFYVAENKVIRPNVVLDEQKLFELFEQTVVVPAASLSAVVNNLNANP